MKKALFLLALLGWCGGAALAQTYTNLYSFPPYSGDPETNATGALPNCGLVEAGGVLFGTGESGGTNGQGVIFSIHPDGTQFTDLHEFSALSGSIYGNNPDGAEPYATPLLYSNQLYGTCRIGGTSGFGSIYRINLDGTQFTNLHNFTDGGGAPHAGLIVANNVLYGATLSGGTGYGTVFRINPDGSGFTNLHSFTAEPSDAFGPAAALVCSQGVLYGTTTGGGSSNGGVVFSVGTDGKGYANLFNFIKPVGQGQPTTTNVTGGEPYAPLILSGDTLFGTTLYGGTNGNGVIFSIKTNGTGFANLHTFGPGSTGSTNADGVSPQGALLLVGNTLYGTAANGGVAGYGTIFSVHTDGSDFQVVYPFVDLPGSNYIDLGGIAPVNGVVLIGSAFYGTTFGGGGYNGNIFALGVNMTNFTVTVAGNPVAGGTVNGGGTYPSGDSAVLTAMPADGYAFSSWSGDASGSANPLTVVVTSNLNITAEFTASTGLSASVTTNGPGGITPNLNGETLAAGTKHTLVATPDAGAVFTGWTGSINSTDAMLSFIAKSNMVLQANFVTNPFPAAKGVYNGLFSAAGGVAVSSAGMLKSLSISEKGAYSGTLLFAGAAHALSGKFGFDGLATNVIKRPALQGGPVTVLLALAASAGGAPQITGSIDSAAGTSALLANLSVTTFPAGAFTLSLPPQSNAAAPAGFGYAAIDNTPAHALITGALPDGSPINQTVAVAADGSVPVYVSLAAGKGLLFGWLNLGLTNTNSTGLTWIHPSSAKGLDPSAFTETWSGSQFKLLPWSAASAGLAGLTHLSAGGSTAPLGISTTGKITGTGVTGSVNLATGVFKITSGTGAARLSGSGVILAGQTNGAGFYLTKTASEPLELEP